MGNNPDVSKWRLRNMDSDVGILLLKVNTYVGRLFLARISTYFSSI